MTRRTLLAACASPLAGAPAIRREVFRPAPGKGVAIMAYAWYTRPRGGDMLSIEQHWTRSDTIDTAFYRFSKDNGRTWSAPVERRTGERRPDGMLRLHPRGGWPDPASGKFLEFWNAGLLPGDDPLEGMKQWNIYYRISDDGGRTHHADRQVIHAGREFDARHPLPGVYTGKNAVMLGDQPSRELYLRDGSFLLPVEISPLAPDGSLYNPTSGYTYTDAAVLHARWKGGDLEWTMRATIAGDPQRSTRGMDEPTLGSLDRGRLIIVMRGSNDRKPELPSYRWVAFSDDEGRTWTKPAPWTYTTGEPFFSPSACSQLLQHSRGKLYWLGNITPENPRGNRPRYPFVIAEVDRRSGLLIRDSVRTVDDRAPGEDPILTLSNFCAREDRETGEICLHMTRLFARPEGWSGDAFLYRIPVM
jgi:hypothetical protein